MDTPLNKLPKQTHEEIKYSKEKPTKVDESHNVKFLDQLFDKKYMELYFNNIKYNEFSSDSQEKRN